MIKIKINVYDHNHCYDKTDLPSITIRPEEALIALASDGWTSRKQRITGPCHDCSIQSMLVNAIGAVTTPVEKICHIIHMYFYIVRSSSSTSSFSQSI